MNPYGTMGRVLISGFFSALTSAISLSLILVPRRRHRTGLHIEAEDSLLIDDVQRHFRKR